MAILAVVVLAIGGALTLAGLSSDAFWMYLFPNRDRRKPQYASLTFGLICLLVGMLIYLDLAMGHNSAWRLPTQVLTTAAVVGCLGVILFKRPFG